MEVILISAAVWTSSPLSSSYLCWHIISESCCFSISHCWKNFVSLAVFPWHFLSESLSGVTFCNISTQYNWDVQVFLSTVWSHNFCKLLSSNITFVFQCYFCCQNWYIFWFFDYLFKSIQFSPPSNRNAASSFEGNWSCDTVRHRWQSVNGFHDTLVISLYQYERKKTPNGTVKTF